MSLPGEFSKKEKIARIVRVDHAGEYGAKRIYAGQLAVLEKTECGPELRHMAEQEEEHLAAFEKEMRERRVRPTALMPLWHVMGFALGAGTALLGKKAAMACTVAVESVIDGHYAEQENALGEDEALLKKMIQKFRADEKEHHDTALNYVEEESSLYTLLTKAIVYQTKLAIWLSTRV